jgi:hypothetical protein
VVHEAASTALATAKGAADAAKRLYEIEQRHETEVHMQLLMAMGQRQPRIVGGESDFRFLLTAQHHHVFPHAGGRFPGDVRQLKTVAMQMHWMYIVAGVTHADSITLPLL